MSVVCVPLMMSRVVLVRAVRGAVRRMVGARVSSVRMVVTRSVGRECRAREKEQSQGRGNFAKHTDPRLNLGAHVNVRAAWSLAARA